MIDTYPRKEKIIKNFIRKSLQNIIRIRVKTVSFKTSKAMCLSSADILIYHYVAWLEIGLVLANNYIEYYLLFGFLFFYIDYAWMTQNI